MPKSPTYAFLPYLRTRTACRIRNIEFRQSSDLAGLDPGEAEDVKTLSRMFYVPRGGRIAEPTYAIIRDSAKESFENAESNYKEAQLLIAYLYAAPHNRATHRDETFLHAECWSSFTFTRDEMIPPALAVSLPDTEDHRLTDIPPPEVAADDFLSGYSGLRDGIAPLWVIANSRIYPETQHVCLNHSQDLAADVKRLTQSAANWPIAELFRGTRLSAANSKRVFTSLLWHSRSCRSTADPIERLMALAIALETLLALDKGDRLTARFKEAITTLVGPVPRLDAWLEQFYAARSGAVHEGDTDNLLFLLPGKKTSIIHRNLIVYGRRIFRICLTAALSGMMLTKSHGLPSLLVHNDERLDDICNLLSSSEAPDRRLSAVEGLFEELHECETLTLGGELEENVEKLYGAGRLLVQTYLAATRSSIPNLDDYLVKIRDVSVSDVDSLIEATKSAEKATEILRKHVRKDGLGGREDETLLRFLEFASRPLVRHQCNRRKRLSEKPKPSTYTGSK